MKLKGKSLWLPGLACLIVMAGCDRGEKEIAPQTRAPQMKKKILNEKPTPEHPEIAAIREEIGEGPKKYDSIRRRLFSLPRELGERDAAALLDMMMRDKGPLWTSLGWAAIVNDGFNVLRELKKPLPQLPGRLLDCYRDGNRPMVLRDYALQHMGLMLATWYRASGEADLLPDPARREEMIKALKDAMKDGTTSLAGTAFNAADGILMSCGVSGAVPPVAEAELAEMGKAMAVSPAAAEHARISAFGFLGSRRSPAALDAARSLMKTETTPVLLRAAAIHYLGMFPDPRDLADFRELAASPDIRLSSPSREALKRNR